LKGAAQATNPIAKMATARPLGFIWFLHKRSNIETHDSANQREAERRKRITK